MEAKDPKTALIMNETYNIITDPSYVWPKGFAKKRKLLVIEGFIQYYEDVNDFERCNHLKQLQDTL